ncbi:MAG: glycosyltransferase family 1 protein [Deltaproteobacteria bacterium]|nr:glycosyltransferase family 1 protein [Deltaproteobacteria bacterium]
MERVKIVYSFNKRGYEAEYWRREIAASSGGSLVFVPFNHDPYLDYELYTRAQLLDNLYFARDARLVRMYSDLEAVLIAADADALVVDNCFPYHPEFLRRLQVYKVLRTTDGPITAYDRDIAYLHAYDHVLFHSPAYSPDMGMAEKLAYCGAKRYDFVPLGLFDAAFRPDRFEDDLFAQPRDVDIVFVGSQVVGKMSLVAAVKRAFGDRFRLHGATTPKRNLYFNLVHGFPGWVSKLPYDQVVPLYQRAKIGFNIHNRGKYTVGSYRLFNLPGNGVMQISDGGQYLDSFFRTGEEIAGYEGADELVEKLHYYLEHESERVEMARAGFRRVMREYRFRDCMKRIASCIAGGMSGRPRDAQAAEQQRAGAPQPSDDGAPRGRDARGGGGGPA